MSCLKVSSSFPPMPRPIYVWAVFNLTFVLLSYTLLHSTTEVPLIVLAIYSLRSGTLKGVNGDGMSAGCANMYLKHYMPFQAIKDVRSHTYLLCNVILFIGCKMCVASPTWIIIRRNHCLLVALWFRFPFELARNVCSLVSGLPIWVRSVSDTALLRMRHENSGARHAI